mmetsp:Transcript_117487/g.332895  ORF Transcript_117487/g.332895 Transcript_117487/m.332895 type:complete len:205 (-) Transcript_117487:353-967(-)
MRRLLAGVHLLRAAVRPAALPVQHDDLECVAQAAQKGPRLESCEDVHPGQGSMQEDAHVLREGQARNEGCLPGRVFQDRPSAAEARVAGAVLALREVLPREPGETRAPARDRLPPADGARHGGDQDLREPRQGQGRQRLPAGAPPVLRAHGDQGPRPDAADVQRPGRQPGRLPVVQRVRRGGPAALQGRARGAAALALPEARQV